ncbi:hypothetical protein [Deinococcus sp.]|uniref:hypothetical protein n=1 Tax=Deinococcus sp. TaxID=47478 RepID=UPI003CC53C71
MLARPGRTTRRLPWWGASGPSCFLLFGYALFRTNSLAARRWVVGLILLCAAYPLYTAGLGSAAVALLGNLVTALVALLAARRAWTTDRLAGWLLPVVPWLIYASWTIVQGL